MTADVKGHPAEYCTLCKNHNKLEQNQLNKKVQIQASKEVLETSTNEVNAFQRGALKRKSECFNCWEK